jgi:hypothetical protein
VNALNLVYHVETNVNVKDVEIELNYSLGLLPSIRKKLDANVRSQNAAKNTVNVTISERSVASNANALTARTYSLSLRKITNVILKKSK